MYAQPAPFNVQSHGQGLGLTFSTNTQGGTTVVDSDSMEFEDLKNNFGVLLGKPTNGLCVEKATTEDEFMCHMDLATAYKKREHHIFGKWVTAQLLNSKNRFLPAVVSPIFETSEMNFTVENTTISAMPFTEIAECGIPEEPSGGYTYAWKETVSRYAQGCTFSRDLMLDPNFGAKFWLQMLAAFVSNARLTIDMGIIINAFHIGYENSRRLRTEGCPVDHHKQRMMEYAGYFIMASNPEGGMNLVKNLEEDIPGINLLIIAYGKSSYFRDVVGDSQTMLIQKLSTDAKSRRAMLDFAEGPQSFKTIRPGDNPIHIVEFTPFYVGDIGQDQKDCKRINPFMTNVTTGQFYPPSPYITLGECIKASCADIHNITIFHQTKVIGIAVDISLRQRMENSIYYDKKTGKVSQKAKDFARLQTQRRGHSPALFPWDWNTRNGAYDHNANIERETTSNSEPNMVELNGIVSLREMFSWREEFVGLTFVPSTGEFKIPKRFGDFHLRSIPNDYVKMAAEFLEAKFNEENGISFEEGMVHLKKLVGAIRHTPWVDAYLFGLLNKNLPKMITVAPGGDAGTSFKLTPERTPLVFHDKKGKSNKNARDQCKFPGAVVIEEVKTNRFGGWDLPDKDGNLKIQYPPGFDNAVGIQTLAQEGLKEGVSLWYQAGREALEATLFVTKVDKFLKKYVGKPDVINPRYLPPWIHKPTSQTMLLDSMIKAAGPVFVGIPASINYEKDAPVATRTKMVPTEGSLLRGTVDETRTYIVNATKSAERVRVDNETRALACLSDKVYLKMHNLIGSAMVIEIVNADELAYTEFIAALHKIYDYAIELCNNTKGANQHKINVETNSIIMDAFYRELEEHQKALQAIQASTNPELAPEGKKAEATAQYRRNDFIKSLRSFVTIFKSSTAMRKFLTEERKRMSPICEDFGVGFLDALRKYEESPVGGISVTATDNDAMVYATKAAPVFRADYSKEPSKFIRAPLASSQALRDYLREKETTWILPADSNLFYAYPEEPRIVTGNSTTETNVHKRKFDLCSLARSNVFQCRLNSKKRPDGGFESNGMDVEESSSDNGDFFSSLKSKSKTASFSKKSMDMSKIFALGKKYADDDDEEDEDPYHRDAMAKARSRKQHISPETGDVDLNGEMAEEYFGPWKQRLAYQVQEISSLAVRFLFGAIIQSKNRSETPIKLSGAGAIILDAFLIRPFIEVRTSAMLAMKSGADTMITTIGHSHVQVTKQSRGCWHIDVGFLMGVIKINPNNIMLIPHAFPESLIGGKNVNFMTNFAEELRLPNPAKPSLISVLVGPDERKWDGPLHATNGESIIRPGIDYAVHLRKHSAGHWLEFLLGAQTVANIDAGVERRDTYAACINQSNVLNQGPASYVNPRNGRIEDVEGNGPQGTFNMNMPGVQDVYEGKATRFPDRYQKYAYQNL